MQPDASSRPETLPARALRGVTLGLAVIGAVIFLSAGSLSFWQGWLYLLIVGTGGSAMTFYFLKRSPELLTSRLDGGPSTERRASQKVAMTLLGLLLSGVIVLPGLDHRFRWSSAHWSLALGGELIVILAGLIMFLTFRANAFASATIEVLGGQTVISTGPYACVRHPMYSGLQLYCLATPLALGSWWGLVPAALVGPVLALRLLDEERLLLTDLAGYDAYRRKVRWRLAPLIW